MNTELLVGTRAFIVVEDLGLYDIKTGELNELDKLTFVEVIVCDRLGKVMKKGPIKKGGFATCMAYKVAPTSSEEAKKVSGEFRDESAKDWDKPFVYDGPISCTLQQLLEIIENEFEQLKQLYSKMVDLTSTYISGPKVDKVDKGELMIHVHGYGELKLAEAIEKLTPTFIEEGNTTDQTVRDLVNAVKELSK